MANDFSKVNIADFSGSNKLEKLYSEIKKLAVNDKEISTAENEELFPTNEEAQEVPGGMDELMDFMAIYEESQVEQNADIPYSATKPINSEPPKLYNGSFNTYTVSEKKYDFTNTPQEYTYQDEVFHCVDFASYTVKDENGNEITWQPQSWEEVADFFSNAGVTNEGQFGTMQCQNYSDMMGQFVLGVADMNFVQSLYDETKNPSALEIENDQAGFIASQAEYNPRNFAPCKAANRDEERAIIENELQNGRPALVYVNDHHWVAAIGLSDDGDILIWDSYNGCVKKLYQTTSSEHHDGKRNPSERNMSHGNGAVMVYVEDFAYENNKTRYIDYVDDYVNGSAEKARIAGTLD